MKVFLKRGEVRLKANRTREKKQVQGNSYISINFSEETMQSKMEWQDIFKLMKKQTKL